MGSSTTDGREIAPAGGPDAQGAEIQAAPGVGMLALCATPIGNLGDVSVRVLEILEEADTIYAEDTRVTRKLLSRYGISAHMERCDENVTASKIPEIVERVSAGQTVVLVSDAGMPGISDPGQRVVAAVREAGLRATVLPGPSASVTAVAGCGIPAGSFYFGGFLPRRRSERRTLLESLSRLDSLLVFYESNRRTVASLSTIAEVFPDRTVCMARELTKIHEEYLTLPAPQLASEVASRPGELKGEVVLVIGPPVAAPAPDISDEDLRAFASELASRGMGASRIARELTRRFGVSKDTAYEAAVDARAGAGDAM